MGEVTCRHNLSTVKHRLSQLHQGQGGEKERAKERRLWNTTVGQGRRSRLVFDIPSKVLRNGKKTLFCEAMRVREKQQ